MNAVAAAATQLPARRLSLWLLAGLVVYLALTWMFGGADTAAAARRIGLAWILVGVAFTSASIAIRTVRWHGLLQAMDVRVSPAVNGAVYLAGIGLSATPGKVGETIRSAFLVRHGVPVGTSLAAFLADRLSDLHAVVLIALLPLAWTRGAGDAGVLRWSVVLAVIAMAPMLLSLLVRRDVWPRLMGVLQRARWLRRPADWLQRGALDFTRLWRPRVALLSISASLIAYGLQAAIFAGMVAQVAPQVPWATACWIFAAGTLAGAASFIPGGVGAMELALVLLLREQGVDGASALAATLCLRAVTFWFGLLLGALGLSVAARMQRA